MTIESKMFLGPLVVPLKLFGSFKNLKKVRKTADFKMKSAVFMVAGAGFEPTTSGL